MTVATGDSIEEIQSRYDGQGYGAFKEDVAESVITLLEPFQARYREIRDDSGELQRILTLGADKAREASTPTLGVMYERMGFVRLGT
jgi:tryptophanyl-tRNA synthetase